MMYQSHPFLQKLVNETFQKLWFTPTPNHDKEAMTRKILNITDVVSVWARERRAVLRGGNGELDAAWNAVPGSSLNPLLSWFLLQEIGRAHV